MTHRIKKNVQKGQANSFEILYVRFSIVANNIRHIKRRTKYNTIPSTQTCVPDVFILQPIKLLTSAYAHLALLLSSCSLMIDQSQKVNCHAYSLFIYIALASDTLARNIA